MEQRVLLAYDFLQTLLPTTTFGPPQTFTEAGSAVALSEGYRIVGAPFTDDNERTSGSVTIFDASHNAIAIVDNPTPANGDLFGSALAIDGDTVVVGAYGDDTGATGAGNVYDLASGVPVLAATLNNPTPQTSDQFGYSVAVSGDTVAVGAYQDNHSGYAFAGSVYVYDLSSGSPIVTATLINVTPPQGDIFGDAVSISGDLVVVGASRDDTGAVDAGRVYVYELSGGNAVLTATLDNPTPADGDQFGRSVGVSGNTIVVGAGYDDTTGSNAGIAYIYHLSSGVPVLTAVLDNPTPASNEGFGSSISISGDTVVIGTMSDSTTFVGSVYVYDLAGCSPRLTASLSNNSNVSGGWQFGASVAISGDTVVVGAPSDDTHGIFQGAAYVFSAAEALPSCDLDGDGICVEFWHDGRLVARELRGRSDCGRGHD